MTRKEAREGGFIIVFEYEFQKLAADELLELYYQYRDEIDGQKDYLENLVHTTLENLTEIDSIIASHAKGWTISRLSRVSLAALRIGISELLYNSEIPTGIAINEAVQLAKDYEGEKGSAFVNGVLGSVAKTLESAN